MTPIAKSRAVADAEALLGVRHNAPQSELRAAWKRLVFEKHPDRGMGTNADMADINAAYSLLRAQQIDRSVPEPSPEQSNAAPRKVTPSRVRPRPEPKAREKTVSGETRALCEAALARVAETAPAARGHVPVRMIRRGRQVTYFVETPLKKGLNRISLPTGDFIDSRKTLPRVITVQSPATGAARFTVPDAMLARKFPGVTHAEILFGVSTPGTFDAAA